MGAMSTVIKLNELKRKNILRINFNDHKHYFVLNTDRADFCLNGQKIIAQSYDSLWTNDYRKIFPQKEKWNRTHRITKYKQHFYIVPARYGELSYDFFKCCDEVSKEKFLEEIKRRKIK